MLDFYIVNGSSMKMDHLILWNSVAAVETVRFREKICLNQMVPTTAMFFYSWMIQFRSSIPTRRRFMGLE